MALTPSTVTTTNISTIDPLPNDVGGLTAAQFQYLFDKYGIDFTAYFNNTHLPEITALFATNTALQQVIAGQVNIVDSITGKKYVYVVVNGSPGIMEVA
ncbi:hypothetical protein [Dehalobacter restrictus]|uniref:Uncharacterized protein n=1 Tax=Dehalobacter restrictus TaxID=55583 RepID=A0A857DFM3_9FIRM|nr:hypothetical protein [Dehalobacter restrictus]QGZ99437.1 hypothetical protein GQ588_01525 [Dehalobacter restrictus]